MNVARFRECRFDTGGREAAAIHQCQHPPGKIWLRWLLDGPIRVLDVVKFPVRAPLPHGRWDHTASALHVSAEGEFARVQNQIVVISKRLVHQKGKQLLAELVRASAIVANIDDQVPRHLPLDLFECIVEKPAARAPNELSNGEYSDS